MKECRAIAVTVVTTRYSTVIFVGEDGNFAKAIEHQLASNLSYAHASELHASKISTECHGFKSHPGTLHQDDARSILSHVLFGLLSCEIALGIFIIDDLHLIVPGELFHHYIARELLLKIDSAKASGKYFNTYRV